MKRKLQWDAAKAIANVRKHAVTFDEALAALQKDLHVHIIPDQSHSVEEDRYQAIARTLRGEYLLIVYTIRNDNEWLISARPRDYE
ncbi:MAG TPA: BrnT family toxin [Thermoanaerobaculia bacterium]